MPGPQATQTDPRAEQPVRGIVDRLETLSDGSDICFRDVITAFGQHSFAPVLMVPALLVVSPLSGVPLFSSMCGLTIVFISAQMLMKRNHLWLPELFMRRRVDGNKATGAMRWLRGLASWLDRHTRPRFQPMVRWPARQLSQMLCLLCGLAMPVLEIVPFSSSVLGMAVILLATSLLTSDGLFALIGMLAIVVAVSIPIAAIGVL